MAQALDPLGSLGSLADVDSNARARSSFIGGIERAPMRWTLREAS